jgi:hypothetical protein
MSLGPLQLKRPSGWFAAGREIQQAATLLSDGAFKLFLWVCLHAGRASGNLRASASDLARALRKTESDIECSMEELIQAGVCRLLEDGAIEIQDHFWPYQRDQREMTPDPETYIAEVRRMFLRPACVRSVFTTADEKLAADWNRRGIALQQVQRAILLGAIRKYVVLINHQGGTPITSLHYFSELIDEVCCPDIPASYWGYLEYRIKDFERRWRQVRLHADSSPARARETK